MPRRAVLARAVFFPALLVRRFVEPDVDRVDFFPRFAIGSAQLRTSLAICLRGVPQREKRGGLELVLHLHRGELFRRMLRRQALRERSAAGVAPLKFPTRVPECVRLVPPLRVLAELHVRCGRLVGLLQLGERPVAHGAHGIGVLVLQLRIRAAEQLRGTVVLPTALDRGAIEGIGAGAHVRNRIDGRRV